MLDLSWIDKVLSARNQFWFFLRKTIKFKRNGYKESTLIEPVFSPDSELINKKYCFSEMGRQLSPQNWHRNLATLWYLEQMLEGLKWNEFIEVLEPGCQNFSRLPSLEMYFAFHKVQAEVTGVELDAFALTKNFYSLWDHAQYYRSLCKSKTHFLAEDFFSIAKPSDFILCFYPFVSAAPALAWGLPARVAGAQFWIEAFLRNLKKDGHVLVIHQGEWEEQDFDICRKKYSQLVLVLRKELKCPFFSTQHPVRATLYRLQNN